MANFISKIRDARREFANSFNRQYKESIFEGLVHEYDAPEGYVKQFAITARDYFKRLRGEMMPIGLDAKSYEISTLVYKQGYELDRKILDNAKAIQDETTIMQVINTMTDDAVAHKDTQLTTLLESGGSDIFGSAFFGTSVSIWNTDHATSATITNTYSGNGVTAANIKTDFYGGYYDIVMDQRNSAGRLLHGPGIVKQKPIVMCHPDLLDVMEDVFEVETQSSNAGKNKTYKRAEIRINPYLSDTNDYYYFLPSPMFKALCWAKAGRPTLESDANGDTDNASRDAILRDTHLWAARWETGEGYGDRTAVIRVTNS